MTRWLSLAGQGRAGQGRAGQGRAGQGRAGQGRAGQGRAGQGRAGQDPSCVLCLSHCVPVPVLRQEGPVNALHQVVKALCHGRLFVRRLQTDDILA